MSNTATTPELAAPETVVELPRLYGLSDGVYAFALTLLVLDIRIPEVVGAADLSTHLLQLGPKLLIYLISFIVIGGAWGSHQRMLSQIKRGDGLLVWFNLLSLIFVTLLPATANLLGRFPGEFVAIACFAVDVILIQLTALWLWRHATRNRLVNPALDSRVVDSVGRRLLLSVVAFGLSVLIALLSPALGYLFWIGLFILLFTTDWLSWQQDIKTLQASIPLDGASRAQVRVIHGVGPLILHAAPMSDVLVEGTFGGGLDSRIARNGDLVKAELLSSMGRGLMSFRYPWAWGPANVLDWKLSLNPQIPLVLDIETGASQADLDFSGLNATEISLKASASSIDMVLPNHPGQAVVKIEGSTATLLIRVPPGVAAWIREARSLSSVVVDVNRFTLIEDGREYRSPDYDTAQNRVEIHLELSLGSAEII